MGIFDSPRGGSGLGWAGPEMAILKGKLAQILRLQWVGAGPWGGGGLCSVVPARSKHHIGCRFWT